MEAFQFQAPKYEFVGYYCVTNMKTCNILEQEIILTSGFCGSGIQV